MGLGKITTNVFRMEQQMPPVLAAEVSAGDVTIAMKVSCEPIV